MRILLLVPFLFMGCATAGPYAGDAFESLCIKGQLGVEQAVAANEAGDWEKSPGYCAGNTYHDKKDGELREGQSHCKVERFDRVLAAHCSQYLQILEHGD